MSRRSTWALALLVLAAGCGRRDVDALRKQLSSDDWRESLHAVQTLAPDDLRAGDLERIRALARSHPSGLMRVSATFALGSARDRGAFDQLARQLRGGDGTPPDTSWSVRRAAALTLGTLEDAAAVEPLLEGLDDENREVRESAESALTNLVSRSKLLARLRADANDRDPGVRAHGVARLGTLGVVGAADLLARALVDDPEPRVRAAAARALGAIERFPSADRLLVALRDTDPDVRTGTLDLVQPGAAAGIRSRVLERLADPEGAVRAAAGGAIRRIDELPGCERFYADGMSIGSIEDEVTVHDDGSAELARTWMVAVGPGVDQTDSFHLLVPARVRRVLDATVDGSEVSWQDEPDGERPEVILLDAPTRGGELRRLRIHAQLAPGFEQNGGRPRRFVYRGDAAASQPQRSALRIHVPGDAGQVVASPAARSDGSTLTWSPAPREVSLRFPRGALQAAAAVRADARVARDWTYALLVLLVVGLAVGWVVRRAWRRGSPGDDDRILVALAVGLAALLLTPHLVEDNLQFVAYARSLVLDGDLHILDEYFHRNADAVYAPDPRVPYGPVGAAVFWVPALAAAHVVEKGLGLAGIGAVADGMSLPYLMAIQMCAALLVTCAWLMAYRMARRRWSRRASLLGVAGIALGTNALMFQYMWTGSSHAPSLFLTTSVLYLLDRPRRSARLWVLCGVCAGLCVITRSQNMALLPIVLLVWAREAQERGSRALAPSVGLGLAFLGGMVLGFLPQALVSFSLDGSPISDLYGVGHGRFAIGVHRLWPLLIGGRPETPFSPTGVLTTMPLLLAAAVGIVRVARRQPFTGLVFTLVVLGQVAAVTSYAVWWGRMFLATSYLINLFAIAAVGLAGAIDKMDERFPRARAAWIAAIVIGCLPSLRAILLEASWRQTSLPARTPFWTYVHGAVFLPDSAFHRSFIERHGNLAWPVRAAVEALRTTDFVALVGWALSLAALLALGWWLAAFPSRAERRGNAATAAFAALLPLAVGFALIAGRAGWRTDLEFRYAFDSQKRDDCEVMPLILAEPGGTGDLSVDPDLSVHRLDLVTFGRDMLDLPTGTPVARVTVHLADGRRLVRSLRLGVETADAEVENPDRSSQHGLAQAPVQHRYVRDGGTRTYPAHAYLTSFEIVPATAVVRVSVENEADHGSLWVTQVLAVQLAPTPGWRASRPSRWMAYR